MYLPDLVKDATASLWQLSQSRKEAILAIPDRKERSATFAAAYADVFTRCPQLEWAGMAAFVAKDIGNEFTHLRSTPVHGELAAMTRDIFDSTYAYLDYYAALKAAYPQAAPGSLAPFMPSEMPGALRACFTRIDAGEAREGALDMLGYEQRDVLQQAHYDHPYFRTMLRVNEVLRQFVERVDVALAATSPEETPDERGVEIRFPISAASITRLADRMVFSNAIAACFFKLCDTPGGRDYLHEELGCIISRCKHPELVLNRRNQPSSAPAPDGFSASLPS